MVQAGTKVAKAQQLLSLIAIVVTERDSGKIEVRSNGATSTNISPLRAKWKPFG